MASMADITPDILLVDVERLCNVNTVLSSWDMLRCYRIGQAISAVQRRSALDAVARAAGRPVLSVYITLYKRAK